MRNSQKNKMNSSTGYLSSRVASIQNSILNSRAKMLFYFFSVLDCIELMESEEKKINKFYYEQ